MKNIIKCLIVIFAFIIHVEIFPQEITNPIQLSEKNLSGPRLGLTIVHGKGELVNSMKRNDMDRLLSQFGWHFEYQVSPSSMIGPSFVIQFVPLVGGVEYGKLVPSFTTAFGIRFPSGYEFGMGPNLVVSKDSYDETIISSSLVVAAGFSINYGGVSIPLNLAYSISPSGNRASFIFGYSLE